MWLVPRHAATVRTGGTAQYYCAATTTSSSICSTEACGAVVGQVTEAPENVQLYQVFRLSLSFTRIVELAGGSESNENVTASTFCGSDVFKT